MISSAVHIHGNVFVAFLQKCQESRKLPNEAFTSHAIDADRAATLRSF